MHYQGCEVDSHWDSSPLWEGINDAAAGELIALLLESRELEVLLCSAANTLIKASVSRQFVQNKQTQSLAWCCIGDYCCHLTDVRFKLLKDELRSVCLELDSLSVWEELSQKIADVATAAGPSDAARPR